MISVPFHGLHIECHYEPGRRRDPLVTDLDDQPEVLSIEGGTVTEDAAPGLTRYVATLPVEFVDWLRETCSTEIYEAMVEAERSRARGL